MLCFMLALIVRLFASISAMGISMVACAYLPEPTEYVLTVETQEAVFSYYCPCSACCGQNTGVTAAGTKAVAGRTIAASEEIPFGSYIVDGDTIYTVEDRGGAIKDNKFDVYVNSHQEALEKGIEHKTIEIVRFNEGIEGKWTKEKIKNMVYKSM